MGNTNYINKNKNNHNSEVHISKEVYINPKKILQVEGKGKKVNEASENANKKFIAEYRENPAFPQNISLALSKMIPIVLKENDNFKSELFEKKDLLKLIKDKQILKLPSQNVKLEGFKHVVESKKYKTSSRLICGLGSANVLETSITLHHIYGVPYIPASSFKGICREVVFWDLAEEKRINNHENLQNFEKEFYGELFFDDEDILVYQLLFGAQNFKGLLLFFDIYPSSSNNKIFDLDIMNPHYTEYYSDNDRKAPGDWENPVPIFFLTIKEGVEFEFNVLFDQWRWDKIKKEGFSIKKGEETFILTFADKYEKDEKDEKHKKITVNKSKIEDLLNSENFISKIIKKALELYGTGSKRNVGYGYFKV